MDFSLLQGEGATKNEDSTTPANKIGGIDRNFVENIDTYELIMPEMICPVCLRIFLDPRECSECHSMVCSDCYFILSTAGKSCAKADCTKGQMLRSNKYIREILEELRIKCFACKKGGMSYKQYIDHIKECKEYNDTPIQQMMREIKAKDEEINKLKKRIKDGLEEMNERPEISEALRKRYLTNRLSSTDKMTLYESALGNTPKKFKDYIETNGFPMFEEVSSPGCFWTPLHYAMHYGKLETIEYILDTCIKNKTFDDIMRLKSNDGRDPLLCLLRSSALNKENKMKIFKKLVAKYDFKYSAKVRKDLKARNMDWVIKK